MSLHAKLQMTQGDFTLDAGITLPSDGVTALFGPSGGGKSTLLSALAGLKRADGRITLGDRALHDLPPHKRGFGLVFQDARLFPHLTAGQNIAYAAKRARARFSQSEVAEFFEITPLLDRPIANLSGGEKSRVALARALVAAPDYLLLDEPFAALDGARRRSFIAVLLAAHRRFGIPMLVVTHSMDDAASLATHLVGLKDGKVVAQGSFGEVAQEASFQSLLDFHDIGAFTTAITRANGEPVQGAWLRADHVLVAAQRPQAVSARNILEARIDYLRAETADSILAGLQTQAGMILARITHGAVQELELTRGKTVWALVKAHSV